MPGIVIALVLLAGCVPQGGPGQETVPGTGSGATVEPPSQPTVEGVRKFSSVEELRDYLKEQQEENGVNALYATRSLAGEGVMDVMVAGSAEATPMIAPQAKAGAEEYSTTNVQVAGVDEADFVKNDEKYIYMLQGDTLFIVDAYPPKDAGLVSETRLEGIPSQLFINGDTLVVITQHWQKVFGFSQSEFLPMPRSTQLTKVLLYNVSDRSEPELIDEYAVTGNYFEARMIGQEVFLLTRQGVDWYGGLPEVPRILHDGEVILRPDIYHFKDDGARQYTTIVKLVLDGDLVAKSYLTGYATTLYVSKDNLYVAYKPSPSRDWWLKEREERFWKVIVPALPATYRNAIRNIKENNTYERWDAIANEFQRMYEDLGDDGMERLFERIADDLEEWELERAKERDKTVIHRVATSTLEHKGSGTVPGSLLNQFSMDEQDGKLRVATTTQLWAGRKSTQYNNVYVLDEEMNVIGKLEGIAEDERIYSTRFMGDRLYMVTFQRIDPLFVIDLSEPANPRVLGELKISGFSDYLHPYDEDHIIGVGKETKGNEWGGVSIKGIKVALFDVSDVEHPEQVDSVVIGGPGSSTEVSRDHKAFLFDKGKELMVLPVREVKDDWEWERRWSYRRNRVWQGAYVFTVTKDGFERRGKIAHYEGEEESGWYWGSPNAIRRVLFMDDVLYTISNRKVGMHDINTIEELNSVRIPRYENKPYPVPLRGTVEPWSDVAIE